MHALPVSNKHTLPKAIAGRTHTAVRYFYRAKSLCSQVIIFLLTALDILIYAHHLSIVGRNRKSESPGPDDQPQTSSGLEVDKARSKRGHRAATSP